MLMNLPKSSRYLCQRLPPWLQPLPLAGKLRVLEPLGCKTSEVGITKELGKATLGNISYGLASVQITGVMTLEWLKRGSIHVRGGDAPITMEGQLGSRGQASATMAESRAGSGNSFLYENRMLDVKCWLMGTT